MKILLVEDELALQSSVRQYLEQEGYTVTTADTYSQATQKAHDHEYDCIILDVVLPDGDGFSLVSDLKNRQSMAGIIIVSAKNSLADKLAGLDIGADDYLTKPFYLPELNARIRSVLRRRLFTGQNTLNVGELHIWPNLQRVAVHNKTLTLTNKEFELLLFFVSNSDRILSKLAIAEHVWGDAMDVADSHEFVYTHIKNLRRKLVAAGCPDYIQTRYGAGYLFSTRTL